MWIRTLTAATFALAVGQGEASRALTIATLSNHMDTSWSKDSGCLEGDNRNLVACNLKVYRAAMEAAAAANRSVDIVLFPEGYALDGTATKSSFMEPAIFEVSDNPCQMAAANATINTTVPSMTTISCLASEFSMGIGANVFTVDPATNKAHITELFFDAVGAISAIYHKHQLFVTEEFVFTPGPFNPTVFDFHPVSGGEDDAPVRIGLIICWEGYYPDVTGDWSQLDGMANQSTSLLLWSIGMEVGFIKDFSMPKTSAMIAQKYNFSVAATVNRESGVAVEAGGAAVSVAESIPLSVAGYDAKHAALTVYEHVIA